MSHEILDIADAQGEIKFQLLTKSQILAGVGYEQTNIFRKGYKNHVGLLNV